MKRRILCGLLAAMLCVGTFSGCSSSGGSSDNQAAQPENNQATTEGESASTAPANAEDLPFTKLTLIMFGDQSPRMQELMKGEFAEIIKNEINAEVELQYIPWGEYGVGNKVDLMIAAGEEFDGARTHSDWAVQSVARGYLMDLTDIADTYLPDLRQHVPQEAFDSLTFNGKLYAIPMGNKPSAGHFSSVCVREDILQEVGMTEITSLEDLDTFANLAKEKYPEMYATPDPNNSAWLLRGASDRNLVITEFPGLYFDEENGQFVSIADSEEFKTVSELRSKWYQENLTPADLLTNRVGNKALFESGNYLFWRGSSGTTIVENLPGLRTAVSTADVKEYWMKPEKPKYKSMFTDYAWQVPAYSKNAERLAMFVNLLQKNTEYVDMFTYGMEGVDYELVDGKINQLQTDELFYQWAMFNTNISTFDVNYPDDFIEVYKNWDEGAVKSKLVGFALDMDPIKTEVAKINAVWEEYGTAMDVGMLPYADNIDKLKAELERASFDKYMEEIQRQFDEYQASL